MNIRFDMNQVVQAIDNLKAAYPEIAEDDILRADMLEAETDLHGLLSKLVGLAGDAATMATAIKIRGADLFARKARYERQEEGIRSLIQSLMEKADLQRVTLPEATLSVSFRKPARVVVDADQLPDELCRYERKPDLEKVRDAAALPPGCAMSNGKNVLTVRTK